MQARTRPRCANPSRVSCCGDQPGNNYTAYGHARAPKQAPKRAEGVKAFFVNDPSRDMIEIKDLRGVDADMSSTIDASELAALRTRPIRLSTANELMELLSTHPNMLRRIKHLSSLM